jgi:hypothetical protein
MLAINARKTLDHATVWSSTIENMSISDQSPPIKDPTFDLGRKYEHLQ